MASWHLHQKISFDIFTEYPRPLICISAREFRHDNFNNTANITFKEYKKGKWQVDDSSPEELFDFLAPNLHDLIDGLDIGKLFQSIGNKYSKVHVPIGPDEKYSQLGIKTTRKDYYEYLKSYCLTLM